MKEKVKEAIDTAVSNFIETGQEIYFSQLVKIISPYLKSFIINIVKDEYAAEEVLCTTLYSIYNSIDKFNKEKASFNTWMCTIAKNNSVNYLKQFNRRNENEIYFGVVFDNVDDEKSDVEYDESYDVEMIVNEKEVKIYDKERVFSEFYDASVKCIEKLPVEYKSYIREQLINNKTVEDIARENSVPVTSLKNWLRTGKMMLREIIMAEHGNLYNIYMNTSF